MMFIYTEMLYTLIYLVHMMLHLPGSGQLRQLQHWTALQPKWQGDAMGMEADSDALKWEKGVLEQMSECLQAFSVWREKDQNQGEMMKSSTSEHQWRYLSTDLYGQMVNGKLTLKFLQFELQACVILLVILNGAMQPKQLNCCNSVQPLCTQTFSTIHSFAV